MAVAIRLLKYKQPFGNIVAQYPRRGKDKQIVGVTGMC